MNFSFSKASRSTVAAGAFLLLGGLAFVCVAAAQDTSTAPAAGQQAAKNYKDRAEYDLYSKITQTTDPKAQLELLNTWQDKYPQTDFAEERAVYFVNALGKLAPSDAGSRPKLLDKAGELLKLNPKNFLANYFILLWGPVVGGTSPSSDVLSETDTAAHTMLNGLADDTFSASKKPASTSDADWTKAKNQVVAMAHNALAWEATTKKDTATAETEYKASLEANPNQGRVSAAYGKLLIDDKKYPEGLFEYARAAEYDGQDAVPAANRPQLMDYFKKAYNDYHGGTDGEDQILAQAKTDALPPAGLNITSAADIANKQADAMNARIASDPGFKAWYAIKATLQDKGDAFFDSDVKGAELPGDAVPSKNFTGTVISIDPPDKPTKVVLGIEDATKPDATLLFSAPLPAEALPKVQPGQKLDFSGVADSYTKDPYMLTFKDPSIPGVQTTAPAKKGTTRRRRPPAK